MSAPTIFLSHTSALARQPAGRSFVAAALDAVAEACHVPRDMRYFTADDRTPGQVCIEAVRQCSVYVGIFGLDYGSPVRDRPDVSYTELEFLTALEEKQSRGLCVFAFLLDEAVPVSGRDRLDSRQATFRQRVLDSGVTAARFATPDGLQHVVFRTLTEKLPPPRQPLQVAGNWLPSVTGERLFGRDEQLRQLDEAWDNPRTHTLSIVAWGGVGKSTLLAHWLGRMAERNYGGAERLFVWSFYSQGTRETVASAVPFLDAALRAFGDPNPDAGTLEHKGERLANLVRACRTLLVLDGLEPLQYPPFGQEAGRGGRLKDAGLRTLVKQLAADNPGLCLITTRLAVVDLASWNAYTAPQLDLEHLTPEAGAALLQHLHVRGEAAALRTASVEFGGHALALTLLGTYLRDIFGGDIRRRYDMALLEEDAEQGGHALRVMASYEKWFGQGPELAILRLLGLFDRPADAALVATLRAQPVIPGLTEPLADLSLPQWRRLLARLRQSSLLAQALPEDVETLDAHPLVREYFGSQLPRQTPEGWRLANDRLYEHLKRIPKDLPDTMEEILPLYVAIGHGYRAGRHQEVFDEVYWKRIRRGHQSYSLTVLGAYGEDLGGLAEFFDVPWSRPAAGLSEGAQANVLRWAAYRLGALGYIREAMAPFQAALERYAQGNWDLASVTASVLSQYAVLLGQFDQAQTFARAALEYGEHAGKVFRRLAAMAYLGRAHFAAGNEQEAEVCFFTAESWQRERQPQIPLLSSTSNFYFCEWLLSRGLCVEVQARIAQLLEVRRSPKLLRLIPPDEPTLTSPMNLALDFLCLGRSYVVQAQREQTSCHENAAVHLNRALDLLYESREHAHIPFALLARAELRILLDQLDEAAADLAQAQEIALLGGMNLYQADGHLAAARLHWARHQHDRSADQLEQACRSLATAKQMYTGIGYRCRDSAVADLERLL